MSRVIFFLLVVNLAACTSSEGPEVCASKAILLTTAWEEQLVNRGVDYHKKSQREICYRVGVAGEAQIALAVADANYRGAAVLLESESEVTRVREWAQREGREYAEKKTDSGKILTVVYSGSAKELQETKRQLDCLRSKHSCS